MKFENILYVADSQLKNQVALQRAARLASHQGARLTVLYVLKAAPLERLASFLAVFEDDMEDEILHQTVIRHRQAALDAFIESTDTGLIPIETKVKHGSVTHEVLQEIKESGHDLVIKAAENSHTLTEQIFGTDDMHLMRSCPVPIWIKKAEDDDGEFRILAAVDLVHKGKKYGLEDEVLQTAHDLAKSEDAELHVVHAWHSGLEEGILEHEDLDAWSGKSKLKERVSDLYNDVHQEFTGLIAEHAATGVKTQAHLLEGEPVEIILETIEKHDIDLLIIGSAKRGALEGFFLGSTAETLLNATPCSVLAIRPIKQED
jgi:nucleotide-binding universal stress UspA family protein